MNKEYEEIKNEFEIALEKSIVVKYPEKIYDSMRYSLLAGGKRLRPVMLLEVTRMLCGEYIHAMPSACAVEMLHTQSLIHDDLPCMDNDDYRRGKLTNHKKFDEATAVLAGDALLSYAPKYIIDNTPKTVSPDRILKIINEFCIAAGVDGIISGQIVDLDSEGKEIDKKTLDYLQEYKTAKLFILAVKIGGILGGCDNETLNELENFAQHFGHAFQIYDDILDEIATIEEIGKTPHKDAKAQKQTYVTMYGLEQAKKDAILHLNYAKTILNIKNFKSTILCAIINEIENRIRL